MHENSKIELKRSCIYPKDIQRITGKSERFGRKLLNKIRQNLSKEKHQFISLDEFCQYTGLDPETVRKYMHD
jgi:hypothetical protein